MSNFLFRRDMRKFKDDVIRPDEYVDICPTCGGLFNPNPTAGGKGFALMRVD